MMEMMKRNNNSQLRFQHTLGGWLTARLVTAQRSRRWREEKKTNSHRTAAKLVWTRMCHWNICCERNTARIRGLLSVTGAPIKHNNKGERHSFFRSLFWSVHQAVNCCHGGWGAKGREPHRLFSRLLLKSLIMSDRKRRRTSIRSALGVEFFNSVATTFRITENQQKNMH